MDPFTLCLIFSALIVKLWRVDAQYAKQGKTPPGYGLIEKWLDGRKASGKAPADAKPAKYGMWRYFWQRWQAMWEVLAEGHKVQHQKYLAERTAAIKNGKPRPAKPSLRERIRAGWRWTVDAAVTPVGEPVNKRDGEAPAGSAATEPATPAVDPAEAGPVSACDECGAETTAAADGSWPHPEGSTCPKSPAAAEAAPAAKPGQWADRHPVACVTCRRIQYLFDPPAAGVAYRCPGCESTPAQPTEGDDMTSAGQDSGEVTGIRSAVDYLSRMSAVHHQHADNEALVSRLASFRVGDGDLGLVRTAMTRSQEASEQYADAAKRLEANNAGVREAYAGVPDAADKFAQVAE